MLRSFGGKSKAGVGFKQRNRSFITSPQNTVLIIDIGYLQKNTVDIYQKLSM